MSVPATQPRHSPTTPVSRTRRTPRESGVTCFPPGVSVRRFDPVVRWDYSSSIRSLTCEFEDRRVTRLALSVGARADLQSSLLARSSVHCYRCRSPGLAAPRANGIRRSRQTQRHTHRGPPRRGHVCHVSSSYCWNLVRRGRRLARSRVRLRDSGRDTPVRSPRAVSQTHVFRSEPRLHGYTTRQT